MKNNEYWSLDEVEKFLKPILPSGSGINGQWEFGDSKKCMYARNHFEVLNEAGFRVGSIDFKLRIPKTNPFEFVLMFCTNSKGKRLIKKEGLREYLDETIYNYMVRFFKN